MKTGVIALVLLFTSFSALGMDKRLGISSWAGWSPGQISKADNPHLRSVPLIPRWSDLEPTNNIYKFDTVIGSKLTAAANDGLYVTIKIYVRPGTPTWLYDRMGVPRVYTDRTTDPLGNPTPTEANLHPYYFDPNYRSQFVEMIAAFGEYLDNLPQALRERIIFVQSAEGSTGDGGPYKGNPIDSRYSISTTAWGAFRRETWQHYKQALPPGIPLLVNADANTSVENNWMLANLDVIALKCGMFSHGWNISDGIQRLAGFRALEAQAKALGKPVLTRGEQDAEITTYAWGTRNIPLALYWGCLYATHNQLDQWNLPKDLLKDSANFETCAFFNRYAGLHDAATSPRAFCALVEGLNAADAVRFPANPYGTVSKSNPRRYTSIANAYAAYGARMEDPASATGGGMSNRHRDGYNDVGWNILPGNYSRFLTQINPGSGDVGWWHVDVMKKGSSYKNASKYSRFARGFENASGKNAMHFNLDDNLAGGITNSAGMNLKVTYFDDVAGSTWELQYDQGSGSTMACALAVTNSGSKSWKTIEKTVFDGKFANGGPHGADLSLINTDSLDDIFHLIEVEVLLPPLSLTTNPSIESGGVVGRPYSAKLPAKPNILFAIADDWSYGYAGAYGCKWIKTPAMDRVARDGILFTQAYTPCGKCSPSRASIITGRNPWQLRAAANHGSYFPPEFKSYQEALGEQGYFAGMTGKGWGPGIAKNAAGQEREMVGKPFDAKRLPTRPTQGISPADYAGNFNAFLDAVPKDQPWSFWYGGREPHRVYEYGSGVAKGGKKTSDIDRVPACWPDTEEVRNDMLDYALEVENFDLHLGRMLAELEKRGLLENTLVVVTSDNGMPFPHCKGYAYNNSDHLPLAIMWPKGISKAGRVVDDYVSFIDFAPTFLEVAGIAQSASGMAPITGQSLTEIFKSDQSGRVMAQRDRVLLSKERNDVGRPNDEGYPIRGIVKDGMLYLHNFETNRWPAGLAETGYKDTDDSPTKTAVLATEKNPALKQFFDASFGKLPADQLFDLRRDPDCMTNLATTVAFAALQKQLFDELKQQGDPRMLGNGHVFDKYPYGNTANRNFYEQVMRGEKSTVDKVRE